jgi:hypothetical protein
MSKLSTLAKFGLVISGYVAAILVASGAVYVNQLLTPPDVLQASAGMSAFGDLILFVGVFGILALFPTGLGIFFLARKFLTRK